MLGLTESERRVLTAVSLMLCVGSISLLPLTAQSARDDSRPVDERFGATQWTPSALSFSALRVSRDPFQPFRSLVPGAPVSATLGSDSGGIVLPPNAGASGLESANVDNARADAVVRAVVLGPQSRALVEVGGSVNVLGVGDKLAGGVIESIDERGLVLSSGSRILLTKVRP